MHARVRPLKAQTHTAHSASTEQPQIIVNRMRRMHDLQPWPPELMLPDAEEHLMQSAVHCWTIVLCRLQQATACAARRHQHQQRSSNDRQASLTHLVFRQQREV